MAAKRIVWLGLAALLVIAFTAARAIGAHLKVVQCAGKQLWQEGATTESTVCLSCHDGVLASDRAPRQFTGSAMLQTADHPVMISYMNAYLRNSSELRPPGRLDRRVKLVNGNIECITCHVSSSKERSFLVMQNGRDELCVSCHLK